MPRGREKSPTPREIAASLTVPERVFLFCLASDTDWLRAGVTQATAQHMLVRNLVERRQGVSGYILTDEGRAVFRALLPNG